MLTNATNCSGPAIDLGGCTWSEIDGRRVKGSIAFLRWNSGNRWLRAAELGARAIVFYGIDGWTSLETNQKSTSTPIPVPRFYLPVRPANIEGECRIVCQQRWTMLRSQRVLATIPGSDPALAGERILILCHLDAISAVPSFSDPAEQGISIASTIEIARYFGVKRPRRPIDFAFYDGHSVGLHGERLLADELAQGSKPAYSLICSLDLTFSGAKVGAISQGSLFSARIESREPARRLTAAWGELGRLFGGDEIADLTNETEGRTWRASLGAQVGVAAEPFVLIGYPAATLISTEDARVYYETPAFARPIPTDLGPLSKSLGTALVMLDFAANQPTARTGDDIPPFPATPRKPSARSLVGGLARVEGKAYKFDPARSFLPNVPVPGTVVIADIGYRKLVGSRMELLDIASESGHFSIRGVPTASSYWHTLRQPVRTFGLLGNGSEIKSLATLSSTKTAAQERSFMLNTVSKTASVTMFSPRVSALYSLWDPLDGELLSDIRCVDSKSLAEPMDFEVAAGSDGVALAAVPKDFSASILLGRRDGQFRATQPGNYTGLAALARAEGLVSHNREQAARLERYGMLSAEFREDLARQAGALVRAQIMAGQSNWSATQAESNRLWSMALRSYEPIRSVASDAVFGLFVYLGLLIPFSIVLERLAAPQRRLDKRVYVSAAIFTAAFLSLRALHPAFGVVAHPEVVLVAFVMGVLSISVIAHIWERFDRLSRSDDQRWLLPTGFGVAASIAITSLRRRPLRTFLTAGVLSIVSFALLAFASLSPKWGFDEVRIGDEPSSACEVRLYRAGYAPISAGLAESIDLAADGNSIPVAWAYAGDPTAPGYFLAHSPEDPVRLSAVVGIGRKTGTLGLKSESKNGRPIRLCGIALSSKVTEPGRTYSLPVDYPASSLIQSRASDIDLSRRLTRFGAAQVGEVDFETAMLLGGEIREVRIPYSDSVKCLSAARHLAEQFDLVVESVSGGQRRRIAYRLATTIDGLPLALLALLLGGAFVVNSFAAGAHERRSEIQTLNAIGMPPGQIGAMFLFEAASLALIGIICGYYLAQFAGALVLVTPSLKGLSLNFSSGTGIMCCLLVAGMSLASAAIPARIAVKQLGNRPTEAPPAGDLWRIEAPFTFGAGEADELVERLKAWASLHQVQDGAFIASDIQSVHRELEFTASLHPYDLGLRQNVVFRVEENSTIGICKLQIEITRTAGDHSSWVRANSRFVRSLRHELLEWRAGLTRRVHSSD